MYTNREVFFILQLSVLLFLSPVGRSIPFIFRIIILELLGKGKVFEENIEHITDHCIGLKK